MLKSSKVEEETPRRARTARVPTTEDDEDQWWIACIPQTPRYHSNASWQAHCSVAQHPRNQKKKRQIQRLETPLWSCMQSTRRSTLVRPNLLPVYSPSPGLAMHWLIPTRHQSSLSREGRERSNPEIGGAGDVLWSILCLLLSPPMETEQMDGVQIHDCTRGLGLVRWRWGSCVWSEAQDCACACGGWEVASEVSHFPLTALQPFLLLHVWFILDGKRVSNQLVKTDWKDCVAN